MEAPAPTPDEKLDIVTTAYEGRIAELRRQLDDARAIAARALEALTGARKQIDALGAGVSFGAAYGSTLSRIGNDCRRIAGDMNAVLSSPTAEDAQKWLEEQKAEARRLAVTVVERPTFTMEKDDD